MRYPAQSACEVNASIDCAREIRGNTSKESAVTFLSANAFTVCASFAGDRNEIVIAPDFNCPIASFSSGRTVATTSAVLIAEIPAMDAPAALYSSSW